MRIHLEFCCWFQGDFFGLCRGRGVLFYAEDFRSAGGLVERSSGCAYVMIGRTNDAEHDWERTADDITVLSSRRDRIRFRALALGFFEASVMPSYLYRRCGKTLVDPMWTGVSRKC